MVRSLLEPNSRPRKLTTPSEKAPSASVSRSKKPTSIFDSVAMCVPALVPREIGRPGTARPGVPAGQNDANYQSKVAGAGGQYGPQTQATRPRRQRGRPHLEGDGDGDDYGP